jgi:CBS domain-containing protein
MAPAKKAKDVMVPIAEYAVVNVNDSLREAGMALRQLYCQTEVGHCTEAGHRTALVLGDNGELVGIVDFKAILRVFIPEIAGGLTERLKALGVSIAFAEADATHLDEIYAELPARVAKNAQVPVKEVMLKIRGTISADAGVMEALKTIYENKLTVLPVLEGDKLVGVVRDSDLFLDIASMLAE